MKNKLGIYFMKDVSYYWKMNCFYLLVSCLGFREM